MYQQILGDIRGCEQTFKLCVCKVLNPVGSGYFLRHSTSARPWTGLPQPHSPSSTYVFLAISRMISSRKHRETT